MTLAPAVRDAQAAAVTEIVVAVSIHHADPQFSYAVDTQPVVWAWPAQNATPIRFDIPKGVYSHIGYWDAAGQLVGSRELDAPVTAARKGTFTIPAGGLVEVVL